VSIPLPNLVVLFAGILLAVAPHTLRLPIWITALTAGLFAWRAWITWQGERLPRKWLLFLLVLAGVFSVWMSNRTLFGRDAGVTMLVLFLGLKLMETRNERDVVVVTFLCYFITLTSFLYSQTMATAVHTGVTVLVLTAALVGFNATRRPWQRNFRTAGVLMLQGVPVMLLLFVLFPRIQGPLWAMPQDATSSTTGLSDTMTPGAISRLSQSDAIAFRVKFEGKPPARAQLYWRGPVLWEFDGRTWRQGKAPLSDRYQFAYRGDPTHYEVTLEPHNRGWVFALEMPARAVPGTDLTADFQMISRQPVRNRMRYQMASYLDFAATGGASADELRAGLELPPDSNPRTVALGREWRNQLREPAAIVDRAMAHLRDGGYEYTLIPPLLGRDAADEFLFDTRRGFCEHFASAFTILMRAAGIPARVVTGYQGGDVNPIDDYLVVRQSDAHAWSEVWIGARGWVRIDPTSVAAPARIDSGLAASVPQTDPLPLFHRGNFAWLGRLRYNWEALSNTWNQWVLGYNPDRQRDLLSRIGFGTPSLDKLVTAMFWSVGLALLVVTGFMLRRARPRDPVQRAWAQFCAKLARRGVARRPSEGPDDYARRAVATLPSVAGAVRPIADLYIELRYGRAENPSTALVQLRRLVREF
jgi:transglutaminase-like putative cysteine protease